MCGLPGYFKALHSFQKVEKEKNLVSHYILSFRSLAFEILSACDRIVNSYHCHHITFYVLDFKPVWVLSPLELEGVLC